jgi:hypothetical protein
MTPAQIPARLLLSLGLSLTLTIAAGVRLAYADDPCAAFTWDVHHERALFETNPQILTGGQTASASQTLAADDYIKWN